MVGFLTVYIFGAICGLGSVAYHSLRKRLIDGRLLLLAIPVYLVVGFLVFIRYGFRYG